MLIAKLYLHTKFILRVVSTISFIVARNYANGISFPIINTKRIASDGRYLLRCVLSVRRERERIAFIAIIYLHNCTEYKLMVRHKITIKTELY